MIQKKLKISEFVKDYINLNRTTPFSFKFREYFLPIYDSAARTELFMTGRQCAKSTFLANRQITRACTIPDLDILYEAPQERQSKRYSKQKLKNILYNSPKLQQFLTLNSKGGIEGASVLEYNCFKSNSSIVLSTTFGGPDRDRGASMNDLYVDEVQDQLKDDIAVIAESLSASTRPPYKAWAGTPKSMSNYIQLLWNDSKQIYWHVVCEHCRTIQVPGHPDDISDLHKVFRKEGLVCKKCEKKLNMLNGLWGPENEKGDYNGWHISQLMRLVKDMPGGMMWKDPEGKEGIYDKFLDMTSDKFYNEVLGFSYDSAEKPLTSADLKAVCLDYIKKKYEFDPTSFTPPVIMGIDWGKNNKSHTVVSISYMYDSKPLLIYMKKLTGPEGDSRVTARIIRELYSAFACSAVYCDQGFWFHFKHEIEDIFGIDFVMKNFNFMFYQQDPKHMVKRLSKHKVRMFKLSRNDIMQHFITNIKNKRLSIFNYEEFKEGTFDRDYLAISYETRETKDKSPTLFFPSSGEADMPTDAFHSHLYSWLGLLIYTGKFKPYVDDEKFDKYDAYV